MIEFTLNESGLQDLTIRLESSAPRMLENVAKALQEESYLGASRSSASPYWAYGVREGRITDTGEALHTRSGDLQRSIDASPSVEVGGDFVRGTWGAATPYARIQEKGGITGRNYATHIPARPYLGPVLESMRSEIEEAVRLAVIETLIEQGLTKQ